MGRTFRSSGRLANFEQIQFYFHKQSFADTAFKRFCNIQRKAPVFFNKLQPMCFRVNIPKFLRAAFL